mmetsp:Transcript_9400/g.23806  ORF Transcript_9400/g.23806 Transcript_9400/m.23806 type:complete len:184 (+) Transcript_9400:9-560(+)
MRLWASPFLAAASESCAADGGEASGQCSAATTSCGCGALQRGSFEAPSVAAAAHQNHGLSSGPGESEEEAGVIFMDGGIFEMGLILQDEGDPTIFAMDGEGPRREVSVEPFGLGAFEVSNSRFSKFVASTGYITEAERFGWSFAVEAFLSKTVNDNITQQVDAAPWYGGHKPAKASWCNAQQY